MGGGVFGLAISAWVLNLASLTTTRLSDAARTFLRFGAVFLICASIAYFLTASVRIRDRRPWLPWVFVGLPGLALSSFFAGVLIANGTFLGSGGLAVLALFGVFFYIILEHVIVEFLQERHLREFSDGFIPPRLPTLRILRRRNLVRYDEIDEAGYVEGAGPEMVYLRLHDGTVLHLSERGGITSEFMANLIRKSGGGHSRPK